ncbi:MAG: tRNA dihydrouridine synthase DusB [Bacteroidetes bacterium]|nr:tRNA dihydrouridine synthase DusB [Bacteroidota bacterium]
MARIGNIVIPERALLMAPMEDITDPPFRILCKKYGADLVYSEFVSSEGLIRDAAKSLKKLEIFDEERPVGIQIFGHNEESMVRAAELAAEAGPDMIDINFGCPVQKVVSKGAGVAMLRDLEKMQQLTAAVVKSVNIPVTAKTRIGWDEKSLNIMEAALRLQDAGIAALTIHGRTKVQMYRGTADWRLIGEVKNNPAIRIPIFGNGDVDSAEKAGEMFALYGVDGVMIGRAAIGNPFIFNEIREYFRTGKTIGRPSVAELVCVCRDHIERSIAWKGERTGIVEMRKHYTNYFKDLPDIKAFRVKLVTTYSKDEILNILGEIEERYI